MSLKILFAHSRYQQRGGEDQVVDAEVDMLSRRGHDVRLYEQHNDSIGDMSRARLATQTIWSRDSAKKFEQIAQTFRPDLVHVHNTFPLISPSIYWKATSMGTPVVQTLHNFRLLCPQAMLLRADKVCEKCVNHIPWQAVRYRCYRDSAAQTAVLSTMLTVHRMLGTYRSRIAAYIALTEFSRQKFVEGGLPAERIHIKPNFVDIDYQSDGARANGLFVGRLYPEKGLQQLADAAVSVPGANIDIIGTGPLENMLSKHGCFSVHGWKTPSEVHAAMRRASYLLVPSIWYETFGLIVIEAFANGLPVIASRIGALQELVTDGVTGLLFDPGSAPDLREKIAWAKSHPDELLEMGKRARREYESKYTSDSNYQTLLEIYHSVMTPDP
ncbi:MAG: glycosyltransferase family 4 protein [Gammaproteobacteria bacterium]|nr:glycosyltransferase family 4 protein [Gammaproteobacteria bacterium]